MIIQHFQVESTAWNHHFWLVISIQAGETIELDPFETAGCIPGGPVAVLFDTADR